MKTTQVLSAVLAAGLETMGRNAFSAPGVLSTQTLGFWANDRFYEVEHLNGRLTLLIGSDVEVRFESMEYDGPGAALLFVNRGDVVALIKLKQDEEQK